MTLATEDLGDEGKVPSGRTQLSIILRFEPRATERSRETEAWAAASVVHVTRVHRAFMGRLESRAAYQADHESLVNGFQAAVDACLTGAPER